MMNPKRSSVKWKWAKLELVKRALKGMIALESMALGCTTWITGITSVVLLRLDGVLREAGLEVLPRT
jgi:hypothetical protein